MSTDRLKPAKKSAAKQTNCSNEPLGLPRLAQPAHPVGGERLGHGKSEAHHGWNCGAPRAKTCCWKCPTVIAKIFKGAKSKSSTSVNPCFLYQDLGYSYRRPTWRWIARLRYLRSPSSQRRSAAAVPAQECLQTKPAIRVWRCSKWWIQKLCRLPVPATVTSPVVAECRKDPPLAARSNRQMFKGGVVAALDDISLLFLYACIWRYHAGQRMCSKSGSLHVGGESAVVAWEAALC